MQASRRSVVCGSVWQRVHVACGDRNGAFPLTIRGPLIGDRRTRKKLRQHVAGEVRFDNGTLALYSTDASNYRHIPIGVVVPQSVDDIVAAVRVCREFDAPVLLRGGGTSMGGQCANVAVVIDTSKYLNRVIEVQPEVRRAFVEPGVVCDVLRDAAEEFELTFAPDPGTHSRCTLEA